LTGGTPVTATGGGACNGPKTATLAATGSYLLSTGSDATNGNNGNLDACASGSTARDVVFQLDLPAGVTRVTASVDAGSGAPIVKLHAGTGCSQPANQCAATSGACASATAVAGTDFSGTSIFMSVSEQTATTNDYAVHVVVE
jgi:hypothetical protein